MNTFLTSQCLTLHGYENDPGGIFKIDFHLPRYKRVRATHLAHVVSTVKNGSNHCPARQLLVKFTVKRLPSVTAKELTSPAGIRRLFDVFLSSKFGSLLDV